MSSDVNAVPSTLPTTDRGSSMRAIHLTVAAMAITVLGLAAHLTAQVLPGEEDPPPGYCDGGDCCPGHTPPPGYVCELTDFICVRGGESCYESCTYWCYPE